MATTSGSIGWDAPMPDATASAAASATADFDASSLIDKTRDVKVDANDYSRFKDIGADLEDDAAASKSKSAAAVAPVVNDTCRNCHKPGAKLKCSVCKKAVYCARECQASDWTFHKRICKKPEAPKATPPRRPPTSSTSSSSSSGSKSVSSSSTSTAATKKSTSTTSSSKEVVTDEPDLPSDVRGYKNGLPYFHRELSHDEKKLIGDIAPQKIEPAAVAPAAAAANEGSAWNHAGTFEERVVTKQAKDKLIALFADGVYTAGRCTATFASPEDFTGDASICVVRGKKRYLYDFNFKLPFEVALDDDAATRFKGSFAMREISNDEDYEITGSLAKKPKSAADADAVHKFVTARKGGLQDEVLRLLAQFSQEYQQL